MKNRKHKQYTDEFKSHIVKLARSTPVAQLAKEHRLAPSMIYQWRLKGNGKAAPAPGKAQVSRSVVITLLQGERAITDMLRSGRIKSLDPAHLALLALRNELLS